jgi:glutamate:GABA antiporter
MSSTNIAAGTQIHHPAATTRVKVTGARKYITWTALALMTTGSVASLRSAPAMAVFGLASVFLYVLPAIVFFVPTSLVSAELASGWKGGVYNWVSEGLSAPLGLLAIWCQFAMTIFYYPALLAYVASTIAYVIDPNLANSGIFTAAIIVVLYWGSVLVSSRGVGIIAKLASSGTVIGTLIPGAILVVMGLVFLLQGNHSAAPMNVHHLLPAWTGLAGIVLIVNNFLAYSGMEMNAVHVDEMKNPGRDYPKSIFLAMVLVLAIFILPALVISWVVPSAQISLTAGVMQAFSAFFAHFGLNWLVPLTALAMVIAMLSGMMAWLAGPSKGLLLIGRQYGYLPPRFQKVNADGIQMNILVAQGIVITIIGLLYAFIPGVSNVYWIFSVMTTQVYLITYVLMFIAAAKLRRNQPDHPRGYKAPILRTECVVGVLASVLAILIGFVPPSQFSNSSPVVYGLLILAGILVLGVLPPLALYHFRKPSWKTAVAVDPTVATAQADAQASAAGPAPAARHERANGSARANGPTPATEHSVAPADVTPSPGAEETADAPTDSRAGGSGKGSRPATAAKAAASATARSGNGSVEASTGTGWHRWLPWAIAALVVLLAVAGLVVYKHGKDNQLARARADEVIALFEVHHLVTPVSRNEVINVLGTNGGPACASPNGALTRALRNQQLSNGAATVGSRPIRDSKQVVLGEQLVIQVYCPEKLPGFRQYVNAKKYYPVIRR